MITGAMSYERFIASNTGSTSPGFVATANSDGTITAKHNVASLRVEKEAVSLAQALLIPGLTNKPPGPQITDRYDSNETSTWEYGIGITGDTLYSGALTSANVIWFVVGTKLNLQPGRYYIDQLQARLAFTNDVDNDLQLFALYEVVSGQLVEIKRFDLTSQKTSTTSSHNATYNLGGLELQVESGKEYYFGLGLRGAAGRGSGRPGIRLNLTGPSHSSFEFDGVDGVAELPTNLGAIQSSTTNHHCFILTVRTANRIVYSGASLAALVPRRTDGVCSIKVDTFVGDATPTVIKLVDSAGDRLTLDVDHTDEEITFASTAQALTGQLGDTFAFMMQLNATAANLLYLNLTDGQGGEGADDIATISHHAKDTNTRGGSYTLAAATWRHISITGGGTIGNVQIGWEPIVIFGDSMASYSGRYGQYLPGAFTYPRIDWRAQISGNRLRTTAAGNHTAGYLRYKHTTIGLGDLCELRDVVFCFAGYGLNDISSIGTTPGNIATVTADYFTKFDDIISDLQANENQPLVIGLAPYHHVPNASDLEAQAIIAWIAEYADRADASLFAWITPWWDLVDQTTASDPIPKIRAAYTDDGGTHINATATQAIVPLVAQAYESGFVGGVWGRSFRRYRQVFP